MPDPNYLSEIEREDGTILTIRDAEAHAEIDEMNPTLQEILQGVNDIKSSIGDVGEIVEEVLVGPPTLIEKTITENGTYAAEDDDADGYSSVTVDVSGGGGGGSLSDDVIFFDYDGSVVASYSAADFANLSAMPANPTHAGLTTQGWNWSLADAKAYVASYGKLNIGQMYITSDGKTRLYFTVTKDSLSANLYLNLGNDTELDIDWGDGTEHTRWTRDDDRAYQYHEYVSAGRYVIAIEVITGEFSLSQGLSNIYKVEIGNGAISIGDYAFENCSSLSAITIPNSVTSIGDSAFNCCFSLLSITIPNSVTSIGESTFGCCYALSSITIPNSVTSIANSAFNGCSCLYSITIPNSVTSISYQTFYSCYALSSITIPNSVTSIDESAFNSCYALSSITIPNSVTSIGESTFGDCTCLHSITIPNSVTSISSNAFNGCVGLISTTFESINPPTLGAYALLSSHMNIIRVPQGSLSAYTSAENYPDPSQYIYEEY